MTTDVILSSTQTRINANLSQNLQKQTSSEGKQKICQKFGFKNPKCESDKWKTDKNIPETSIILIISSDFGITSIFSCYDQTCLFLYCTATLSIFTASFSVWTRSSSAVCSSSVAPGSRDWGRRRAELILPMRGHHRMTGHRMTSGSQ